jgi:phosphoribosylformylglycinamidine synthase
VPTQAVELMTNRIEINYKENDARANVLKNKLNGMGLAGKIDSVALTDVYTIDLDVKESNLEKIALMLKNPVVQNSSTTAFIAPEKFDWAIETGFLPGVTDNVATTTREGIEDLLKMKFKEGEDVYTSQVTYITGSITEEEAKEIGNSLVNPLIQRIHIKSSKEFQENNGMGIIVPKVKLEDDPKAEEVDILNVSDDELIVIGKQGIANPDGTRRGPLALDLSYMKAIQAYFAKEGRNPTDVELESIAQTWSEHCKHTIFADEFDEIKEGLYKTYIQGSTNKIREEKGDKDFCVSVFVDNSGAIIFDEEYLVTDKAETHNSPSALDPFGGAITGIVGVNRDAMGFGLGAKPIINRYGFCFGDPKDASPLYKGKDFTQKMLSPRRMMEGVIDGVNVGGNCSGIPTPQGFMVFDDRYKGKPLVFVGTLGLIPRTSVGRNSCEKEAQVGDTIIMIGGRVGKDGIHGATFSSEALDSGSPATAVQIGDPITQKKMSDALVKEARDRGLYTSITDNGAGGLSCSVAEMAKECGGCKVILDDVPLKYPGLSPWETWISESQERMTLSVPKEKLEEFNKLMSARGVESTVIGEFTDSGRCVVDYKGKTVMDVEMGFLHDGLPKRPITTTYTKPTHEEPTIEEKDNLNDTVTSMFKRLNLSSFEFVSKQYDHEVQGGSVIKPMQGRGLVNGEASVSRPLLSSEKGVVISQGINPTYSDVDTYHMAACAIDTAIRNAVSAGADIEYLALMDNFCWCSSTEPERLGQLKEAVKSCYDYSIAYGTPFISGKDSMFNDFKGYDEKGEAVKISVPPTLLISSIGVMQDSNKAVGLDAKIAGDLVYVLGETNDELGASEYFAMNDAIGNNIPKVDAVKNKKLYKALTRAICSEIVASSQSVVNGGLIVALAKTAMGGMLGMTISLADLPGENSRNDFALFSESQGRVVVTVAPKNKEAFEKTMEGNTFKEIGTITENKNLVVSGREGKEIINLDLDKINSAYKETLGGY